MIFWPETKGMTRAMAISTRATEARSKVCGRDWLLEDDVAVPRVNFYTGGFECQARPCQLPPKPAEQLYCLLEFSSINDAVVSAVNR